MERETLYFAHYVHIGSSSPQRARETIAQYHRMINAPGKPSPYDEKHFIIGVRDEESRIELLYPTPFMRREDVEALRQKYEERFKRLVEEITKPETGGIPRDIFQSQPDRSETGVKQNYSIGQRIRVLSGIKPLLTSVKDIKWDERNNCWLYYFDDEEGKQWFENEAAIEEDKS